MILCAALKVSFEDSDERHINDLVIPCRRHGDGFALLKAFNRHDNKIGEGFIDTNGFFFNRKEAFAHAIDCGQLSKTTLWYKEDHNQDELYSEDLY